MRTIALMQREIERIVEQLKVAEIVDKKLNIDIKYKNFVEELLDEVDYVTQTFDISQDVELKYKSIGKVNLDNLINEISTEAMKSVPKNILTKNREIRRQEYRQYEKNIKMQIQVVANTLAKLKEKEKEFEQRKEDYNTYVNYNNLFDHLVDSFSDFKTETKSNIEENIKEDEIETTQEKIENVKIEQKKAEFEFGFRKKAAKEKQKIKEHITEKETEISKHKNKLFNKIISKELLENIEPLPTEVINQDQELKDLTDKITDKISAVKDERIKQHYETEFHRLIHSEVMRDSYFYKEFLDDLNQNEKTANFRTEIQQKIIELNRIEIADSLLNRKKELLNNAVSVIAIGEIKEFVYSDILNQLNNFTSENKRTINEEFIKLRFNQ